MVRELTSSSNSAASSIRPSSCRRRLASPIREQTCGLQIRFGRYSIEPIERPVREDASEMSGALVLIVGVAPWAVRIVAMDNDPSPPVVLTRNVTTPNSATWTDRGLVFGEVRLDHMHFLAR